MPNPIPSFRQVQAHLLERNVRNASEIRGDLHTGPYVHQAPNFITRFWRSLASRCTSADNNAPAHRPAESDIPAERAMRAQARVLGNYTSKQLAKVQVHGSMSRSYGAAFADWAFQSAGVDKNSNRALTGQQDFQLARLAASFERHLDLTGGSARYQFVDAMLNVEQTKLNDTSDDKVAFRVAMKDTIDQFISNRTSAVLGLSHGEVRSLINQRNHLDELNNSELEELYFKLLRISDGARDKLANNTTDAAHLESFKRRVAGHESILGKIAQWKRHVQLQKEQPSKAQWRAYKNLNRNYMKTVRGPKAWAVTDPFRFFQSKAGNTHLKPSRQPLARHDPNPFKPLSVPKDRLGKARYFHRNLKGLRTLGGIVGLRFLKLEQCLDQAAKGDYRPDDLLDHLRYARFQLNRTSIDDMTFGTADFVGTFDIFLGNLIEAVSGEGRVAIPKDGPEPPPPASARARQIQNAFTPNDFRLEHVMPDGPAAKQLTTRQKEAFEHLRQAVLEVDKITQKQKLFSRDLRLALIDLFAHDSDNLAKPLRPDSDDHLIDRSAYDRDFSFLADKVKLSATNLALDAGFLATQAEKAVAEAKSALADNRKAYAKHRKNGDKAAIRELRDRHTEIKRTAHDLEARRAELTDAVVLFRHIASAASRIAETHEVAPLQHKRQRILGLGDDA